MEPNTEIRQNATEFEQNIIDKQTLLDLKNDLCECSSILYQIRDNISPRGTMISLCENCFVCNNNSQKNSAYMLKIRMEDIYRQNNHVIMCETCYDKFNIQKYFDIMNIIREKIWEKYMPIKRSNGDLEFWYIGNFTPVLCELNSLSTTSIYKWLENDKLNIVFLVFNFDGSLEKKVLLSETIELYDNLY
jgi:hypothetical protein